MGPGRKLPRAFLTAGEYMSANLFNVYGETPDRQELVSQATGELVMEAENVPGIIGSPTTNSYAPCEMVGSEYEEEPVDLSGIVREISNGGTPFTLLQLRELLNDYGVDLEGRALLVALQEAQQTIAVQDEELDETRIWVTLGREHGYKTTHFAYAYLRTPAKKTTPPLTTATTSAAIPEQHDTIYAEAARRIVLNPPSGLYDGANPGIEAAFINQDPEAGMREEDIVTALVRRSVYARAVAMAKVRTAIEGGQLVRVRRGKHKLYRLPEAQPELATKGEETTNELENESFDAAPGFVAVRDAIMDNLTGEVANRARTLKQLRLAVGGTMNVSAFNRIARHLQRQGIIFMLTTQTKGAGYKSARIGLTDGAREVVRDSSDMEEARQLLKDLANSS